ncbi:BTAD domain-containing putative transcriptional regulator [Nonomuraea sp. NPDC048916]|uniref:ATP-binding protein n=1 Tax=Nonomuraea sp. NPDC048916 TaxID=3154232 RepID=UPI0033FC0629
MRIGVLGPLQVVADGRDVEVGGPRLRALLIRLALAPGAVVTSHALAGALWPDGGPDRPGPALHSLVSRLRRVLPDGEALRSAPAGYRLDVPADAVDAVRFERLAVQGRLFLRDGRSGAAARQLVEALELWRGDPLADVTGLPYADAAAVRLEEVRLGAIEDLAEARLATGAGPPDVAELEQLIAAHPLRERLRVLQLRALDADGRQPEALAAYERYRVFLADALGTDPGPELQRRHLAVLRVSGRGGEPAAGGVGEGSGLSRRGNLRTPLADLVGREQELRQVGARLADSRLVTLVGPGGVGKTRLAVAAAADFPGQVWVIELAGVTEPADMAAAVARAIGVRISGDVVAGLAEALSVTETLVVLDNCEHLIEPAARLAGELLGRCPGLRVLTTGREPLGITGETLCPVPPLRPDAAARLFAARARAVLPEFEATDEVAGICARLDGLPLAIELAAARLRSMPVDRLATLLDDRFRLLTSGSRTAPPRHRTLRAVVEWSWDLLGEAERVAAGRASVFPSSFTADAAEHVGIAADALHALVDKSLLHLDGGRYHMLGTIREYGLERLADAGRVRGLHAAYYLRLAEEAEPHLRGPGQPAWLGRLAAERDHLLAALRFARDSGDAETAVRLGAALAMFWTAHGDHTEATAWLGSVLQMPGAAPTGARPAAEAGYLFNALFAGRPADTGVVAGGGAGPVAAFVEALLRLGDGASGAGLSALEPHLNHDDAWTRGMLWLARSFLDGARADAAEVERDLVAAVAAFRTAGERWGLSLSLMSLAFTSTAAGAYDEAVAALEESVELARDLGTHHQQRVWLAMVAVHTGDTGLALAHLREAIGEAPSSRLLALARVALAGLARCDGDLDEASRQLGLAGEDGEVPYRALYATEAGHLAVAAGDLDTAARRLAEAFDLARTMPDPPMVAQIGVAVADLLLRRRPRRAGAAAEVLGMAAALRGGPDARHPDVVRLTRELRRTPGHRAAYERGRGLDHAACQARIESLLKGRPSR